MPIFFFISLAQKASFHYLEENQCVSFYCKYIKVITSIQVLLACPIAKGQKQLLAPF